MVYGITKFNELKVLQEFRTMHILTLSVHCPDFNILTTNSTQNVGVAQLLLFLCTYYFWLFRFIVVVYTFPVDSLSLDYICLIYPRILVPLITPGSVFDILYL